MADLLGDFSVFEQRLRNLVDSHKRMFPGNLTFSLFAISTVFNSCVNGINSKVVVIVNLMIVN